MSNSYFRENHSLAILQHFTPNFPPHLHESIELLLVLKGSGDAYCDGEYYRLGPGDAFLVCPNQVHCFVNFPPDGHSFAFLIPPRYLEQAGYAISGKCPTAAKQHITHKGQVTALMKMAWDMGGHKTDVPLVKHYAIAAFEAVISDYTLRGSSAGKDVIPKILDYCSAHFRENISVTDISKQFFMSRSTVSRIFSNKINLSFNDYINSLRISEFMHLMQKRRYSITEAATLSGFSTIRTFNSAFKKHFGVAPSEYLKNNPEVHRKTINE